MFKTYLMNAELPNFMRLRELIFIFFVNWICFVSFPSLAVSSSIRFEHLTIEDGLPQNTVNAIHQDKKGFLWFGTQDGLSRYDGYTFKNYSTNLDNNNSLSTNNVQYIKEDPIGNLFIGTMGGGLNYFDSKTEKFTHFKFISNDHKSLSNNNVISILHSKKIITGLQLKEED